MLRNDPGPVDHRFVILREFVQQLKTQMADAIPQGNTPTVRQLLSVLVSSFLAHSVVQRSCRRTGCLLEGFPDSSQSPHLA